jgi:hypothetical protein
MPNVPEQLEFALSCIMKRLLLKHALLPSASADQQAHC